MIFGALQIPLGDAVEKAFRAVIAASVDTDPCEDLDDLMHDIETGNAVAWVATEGLMIKGAAVTQVLEGSKAKQCFIRHCAGDGVRDWIPYIEIIKMWAESIGCTSIEYIGRPGFARLMGWTVQGVLCRQMLVAAR